MDKLLQNIKAIRKKKKLSSHFMGEQLGIDPSNYNRMEKGESTLTVERLYEIAKIFNIPVKELLNRKNIGNVTYIPVNVRAGNLSEYIDQLEDNETFDFPLINETDLKAIIVDGDSMYPTISQGDNIFVKREENLQNLKWGELYVIDTTSGRVIKRVYPQESEPDKLKLVSDNPVYHPYIISLSEIISIWSVKGKFSRNLSPGR